MPSHDATSFVVTPAMLAEIADAARMVGGMAWRFVSDNGCEPTRAFVGVAHFPSIPVHMLGGMILEGVPVEFEPGKAAWCEGPSN